MLAIRPFARGMGRSVLLPVRSRCTRVRLMSSTKQQHVEKGGNGARAIGAMAVVAIAYALTLYTPQDDNKTADQNLISPQAPVTKRCFLDVDIDGQPTGRVVIGMYGTVTPKTCRNFESLCRGHVIMNDKYKDSILRSLSPRWIPNFATTKLSYVGSTFHRIIPTFIAQGGDIDGKGGRSVYDTVTFDDENYRIQFDGPGVVGMVNEMQPNNNGSQFFILTGHAPYLNGKHTVFGIVLDGWEVVKSIEAQGQLYGPDKGVPLKEVKIVGAGVLDDE